MQQLIQFPWNYENVISDKKASFRLTFTQNWLLKTNSEQIHTVSASLFWRTIRKQPLRQFGRFNECWLSADGSVYGILVRDEEPLPPTQGQRSRSVWRGVPTTQGSSTHCRTFTSQACTRPKKIFCSKSEGGRLDGPLGHLRVWRGVPTIKGH